MRNEELLAGFTGIGRKFRSSDDRFLSERYRLRILIIRLMILRKLGRIPANTPALHRNIATGLSTHKPLIDLPRPFSANSVPEYLLPVTGIG
ncbi:MAG: hypothetical protein IPM21_12095 [Acidobacteria bacterium]|nr:hypothetical protein [Acidobacteriota bacterium]